MVHTKGFLVARMARKASICGCTARMDVGAQGDLTCQGMSYGASSTPYNDTVSERYPQDEPTNPANSLQPSVDSWHNPETSSVHAQIVWPKVNYLINSIQLDPWYLNGGSFATSESVSAGNASMEAAAADDNAGPPEVDAATTLGALTSTAPISAAAAINTTVSWPQPPLLYSDLSLMMGLLFQGHSGRHISQGGHTSWIRREGCEKKGCAHTAPVESFTLV